MSSKQRDRGRILTPDGLSRLQQAIRAWELEHEIRCTQERIKELTSAVKEGGLDPGTTRKILKAKEGVDPESIRCLFTTFGLQLNEADLAPSSRLQVQADPNFVGREGAIADLNALVNRGAKVIVIQARGGVGKTTLARKYLQQEFGSFLEFPIAKETKDIASIESLIEEKLRQLGEEPGREFFVSLDRLKRKLQDERIGILIDNLEPALDSAGKFIEPHRRYVELLRVLTDPTMQSVTFITSRERLREASITVEHYMLRSLDIEAWEQFFQSRNLATDTSAFAALHNAYGGNAKAMDIIRGAVLEDYSGDIAAYWQANQHDLFIERDLEDLVTQQFDRLQQIDTDAYNLLCRMGCYRYQDVPTVPIEGLLCLLWDVPENRQRRVVKSLQDRSLVEFEKGEFWLHPVIRSEAIGLLRDSDDWETANRRAAGFWAEDVEGIGTVQDAIKVFEAYYQYLNNKDFEQAGAVIFRTRNIRCSEAIDLGHFLSRAGLIQLVINTVDLVLNNINSTSYQSILYAILGACHRMIGNIHQAIKYHAKSIEVIGDSNLFIKEVDSNLTFYENKERLKYTNLVNVGLCKIELLEFEEAQDIFSSLKQVLEEDDRYRPTVEACLIFLSSSLAPHQINTEVLDQIYMNFEEDKDNTGRGFRLMFLGMAYKNLKKYDASLQMYYESIRHSEKLRYTVTKAIVLTYVGEIHREKSNFVSAIKFHSESIKILLEVGAVYDLAKAKYQLGLTYQAMDEVEKGNESFQEAIRLFNEMEAPKQVERVRRSMEN